MRYSNVPWPVVLFRNFVVLPAWLLLAVVPHHRITQFLVHAIWMPLLLGPLYIWASFDVLGIEAT
jgi:hypothetical protein